MFITLRARDKNASSRVYKLSRRRL